MGHAVAGRLGQLLQLTAGKKAKKVEALRLPRPAYLAKKPKGNRIKTASDLAAFAKKIGGIGG